MSTSGDFKPRNFRIVRHVTKSSILVIEDCLRLGKLRVEVVSYQRGEGVRAVAEHYLDVDTARLLFTDLAAGQLPASYQEYKGTMRDGQAHSRIFNLSEAKAQNPIKLEIANGPGEMVGEGAIKPLGKPTVSLAVLLSRSDARRIALAVLEHLSAWAAATYYQRTSDETWQPPRDALVDAETGEMTG